MLTYDEADARLVHAVWESLQQTTCLYVIAVHHQEMRRLVFRYTQPDAEMIRELFAGVPNRDFVTLPDVPWMGKEFTRGCDEEDFSYDELALVFGSEGW